jgi:hypothetical protein
VPQEYAILAKIGDVEPLESVLVSHDAVKNTILCECPSLVLGSIHIIDVAGVRESMSAESLSADCALIKEVFHGSTVD